MATTPCVSRDTCHVSDVTCQLSGVRCHMLVVTCQVSHARCHMSGATCHMSYFSLPSLEQCLSPYLHYLNFLPFTDIRTVPLNIPSVTQYSSLYLEQQNAVPSTHKYTAYSNTVPPPHINTVPPPHINTLPPPLSTIKEYPHPLLPTVTLHCGPHFYLQYHSDQT